jgi:hypothetical protein
LIPRTPALWAAASIAAGCVAQDQAERPSEPTAESAPQQGLLIEELYYAGAKPEGGADHYYSDQFLELVNATDAPMDLSGILIGEVFGAAGEINDGMTPDSFRESMPDQVVLASVWRIPDGVVVPARETLIIAHDGTNHLPFSTVDLSGVDLEAFVADSGGDDDSPTVPNLELVHFTGGYDWLLTVFGPSIVVLQAGTELGDQPGPYSDLKTAPTESVIDAIETLMDRNSGDFKRLPDAIDTGHAWVSGTYSGKSLHRIHDGEAWQHTADSGADFTKGPPAPALGQGSGAVTGEVWLELGTGRFSYEPLQDEIEVVAGPQGGWHVDVSLRFGGFEPDGVVVVYDAVDANTADAVSFTTVAQLSQTSVLPADDGWERVGDRVVLDIATVDEVVGRDIVVRVTAEVGEGTWSDERPVTVVDLEP